MCSGYWTRTVAMCVRFCSQVRYPYDEFVHSIPSYFSKCIITTIRLSRLSQRIKTTSAPLASRLIPLILSFTCNPVAYKQAATLCVPQSTSYSFASTISTCCSAWAWDHECHITAYDLSRQRRRSVILVCIPHEITVYQQLSSQTIVDGVQKNAYE